MNSGIVEKLIPMMRAAEQAACEQTEATVVFILLRGFESSEGQPPDAVLRATNSILDRIVSKFTSKTVSSKNSSATASLQCSAGMVTLERAVRTCFAVHAALPRITAEAPADDVGMNRRIQAAIGIDSGQVPARWRRFTPARTDGLHRTWERGRDRTANGGYATPDQTTCSEQAAHLLVVRFVCESAGTCSLPQPR